MTMLITIDEYENVASFLAHCCDAIYAALAVNAAKLDDDRCVIAAHELARVMGQHREQFDDLVRPNSQRDMSTSPRVGDTISRAFGDAANQDHSGLLTAYVVTMLVGPKFLITLRDVVEISVGSSNGPLRQRAQLTASVLLGHMHAFGEAARHLAGLDEDEFRQLSSKLDNLFSQAGYAESFGIGPSG